MIQTYGKKSIKERLSNAKMRIKNYIEKRKLIQENALAKQAAAADERLKREKMLVGYKKRIAASNKYTQSNRPKSNYKPFGSLNMGGSSGSDDIIGGIFGTPRKTKRKTKRGGFNIFDQL